MYSFYNEFQLLCLLLHAMSLSLVLVAFWWICFRDIVQNNVRKVEEFFCGEKLATVVSSLPCPGIEKR